MVKKFTSKIKAAVFCGCSCCNGNIWPRDFQPGCNQRALQMDNVVIAEAEDLCRV